MVLLGQVQALLPRGAVMVHTAPPTDRVTALPSICFTSGWAADRSFFAPVHRTFVAERDEIFLVRRQQGGGQGMGDLHVPSPPLMFS